MVLIVSTDSDAMADATAVLHQSGNGMDLRFSPADTTRVSALVWGEIYRRNSNWRLRAVGQGWSDGLAGLARDYGGERRLTSKSVRGELRRFAWGNARYGHLRDRVSARPFRASRPLVRSCRWCIRLALATTFRYSCGAARSSLSRASKSNIYLRSLGWRRDLSRLELPPGRPRGLLKAQR